MIQLPTKVTWFFYFNFISSWNTRLSQSKTSNILTSTQLIGTVFVKPNIYSVSLVQDGWIELTHCFAILLKELFFFFFINAHNPGLYRNLDKPDSDVNPFVLLFPFGAPNPWAAMTPQTNIPFCSSISGPLCSTWHTTHVQIKQGFFFFF